jgi:hypothetical protein
MISSPVVIAGAVFSGDERYRYRLTRIWEVSRQQVLFVMLNPSTADADKDDQTIRKCMARAARNHGSELSR